MAFSLLSLLRARPDTLRKLANSSARLAEFFFRREIDMDVHLAAFRAFESEPLDRFPFKIVEKHLYRRQVAPERFSKAARATARAQLVSPLSFSFASNFGLSVSCAILRSSSVSGSFLGRPPGFPV